MSDVHDHAWVSTELALTVLDLTRQDEILRQRFALHAAAVVSTVLGANRSSSAEYFEEVSGWDESLGNREDRSAPNGPMRLEPESASLDDVRLLIDQKDPGWPDFWQLLLQTWHREIDRRHGYLSDRQANDLQAQPDYLILDALHLFFNRLGIGLGVECYLYYLVAGLLRDRMSRQPRTLASGL